ncbi:MAG TPA: SDR family oxidoreductase [Savagea sp.]
MRLQQKVVLITGGAGGIGRGMAFAMAKEGARVVIADVNAETGKATERELNEWTEALFIEVDLMDRAQLPRLVEQTIERFGRLDVLVNNAHASRQRSFMETTEDDLELSFGTGFYPTFFLMQAAYPALKATEGTVINFASGAGIAGNVNQASYAAAKEAIRGITRVAANEWGVDNINCNLISPIANSPGVQQWKEAQPEAYETMVEKIPLRRLGELEEDIGRVAVFLASDDARYMTGQTLMVDGGAIQLR